MADRFLSLSGITGADLRQSAGEPWLLAAFLDFLEAHEPDLIAVANAIGRKPEEMVAARRGLQA